MARVEKKQVDDGQGFYLFNDVDEVIGFAVAGASGNTVELGSIHIIPGERGKGHGGELLDAVISWGKDQGATKLEGEFWPEERGGQVEQGARRFYIKHGVRVENGGLSGDIN